MNFSGLSPSEKKQLVSVILCLVSGVAVIIIGIYALFNGDKTINAVSSVLGGCALVTAALSLYANIVQVKVFGKRAISIDFVIWLIISLLLFNTSILNKLGKLAFIILGVIVLIKGLFSIFAAVSGIRNNDMYVRYFVYSAFWFIAGILMIANAEAIFTGMIVTVIGLFFIVQGGKIVYDGIGRWRYFRNFRGLDN